MADCRLLGVQASLDLYGLADTADFDAKLKDALHQELPAPESPSTRGKRRSRKPSA